jgi:biopolymer transport protein ExbD/biopolymer transport protein TolR
MGISVRNEGSKVTSDINVTPMVDVMLVLLIIFMVITPLLDQKVNVDLAKSQNAVAMKNASKSDAVIVAVTRDNKVFLGQNQVTLTKLGKEVSSDLENKTNKVVYIRADAESTYSTVEDAIDAVRSAAGVQQFGLLTDQRQGGAPLPPTGVAGQ